MGPVTLSRTTRSLALLRNVFSPVPGVPCPCHVFCRRKFPQISQRHVTKWEEPRTGGCRHALLIGRCPDYCVTALHLGRLALIQGAVGWCPRDARRGRIFLVRVFHLDSVCALRPIEQHTSNKFQTR